MAVEAGIIVRNTKVTMGPLLSILGLNRVTVGKESNQLSLISFVSLFKNKLFSLKKFRELLQ